MRHNFILQSVLFVGLFPIILFGDEPVKPPTPGVVNIHLKQAYPEDVFSELEEQSGIKIIRNQKMWNPRSIQTACDIDFTNKPFWQAFREACGLWNLVPQPTYGRVGSRQIMLEQAATNEYWSLPPSCESNGFLFQAISATRTATISYASTDHNRIGSSNLCFTIYVDPALRIVSMDRSPKVREAVDEAGHSLVAQNDINPGNSQLGSMIYVCAVPIDLPANVGKKIAHVKCVLNLLAGSELQTLSIDKPLISGESQKSFGFADVVFHSMKKTGSQFEVKISIRLHGDTRPGEWWSIAQMCKLHDASGREFLLDGPHGGVSTDSENEHTLCYLIDSARPLNEPANWSIRLPINVREMQIPMEFKDLPLP